MKISFTVSKEQFKFIEEQKHKGVSIAWICRKSLDLYMSSSNQSNERNSITKRIENGAEVK